MLSSTNFIEEMLPQKRRFKPISGYLITLYITLMRHYLIIKKTGHAFTHNRFSIKKKYYLQALNMPHIKIEVITQ